MRNWITITKSLVYKYLLWNFSFLLFGSIALSYSIKHRLPFGVALLGFLLMGFGLFNVANVIYSLSYLPDVGKTVADDSDDIKYLTVYAAPIEHSPFSVFYACHDGNYYLTRQGSLLTFCKDTISFKGLFALHRLALFCLTHGYELVST